MMPIKYISTLVLALMFTSCGGQTTPDIREGDIIFQSLLTKQSKAIELATHSQYTHVGVIIRRGDKLAVYEGVGPVKYTPIDEWIAHGEGSRYAVRRLKDTSWFADRTNAERFRHAGKRYHGKAYDFVFDWSDEEIYCSELVWKMYNAVGITLAAPKPLKSFDLSSAEVRRIMKSRYGDKVPLDEPMISPQQLFDSELLMTVAEE